MKKIAVAGTGAIGALFGSYLTRAGYDVTMIAMFRPEQARLLNEHGLDMEGYGDPFHADVKAAFIGDLETKTAYDIILLTMKSNQLEESLPLLKGHLAADGILVPLENGIHDRVLERFVPREQIVTGVIYCGGSQIEPGCFMNHDGEIYVGEAAGGMSERAQALAQILGWVRPARAVEQIRAMQWDKMSRVCLTVPTATVSGLYLGDVFMHPDTQMLFAKLALELFAAAQAEGFTLETIEGKDRPEWERVLRGEHTGLEGRDKDEPWPPGIVDAYTMDIRKGLPLEIGFTNGAVLQIGREHGVPVRTHEVLLETIYAIERGEKTPGIDLLKKVIAEAS